jgi:phosphatidylserine/phosphatidylglycerophosphate/cardiolipin synthase-like enzyme
MLEILKNLPAQVRPMFISGRAQDTFLLTGSSWAPTLCAALSNAKKSIQIIQYSVSSRWGRHANDQYNVYRELLSAPARGVRCSAILAEHRRTAATKRFNRQAGAAMLDAGWSVHGVSASNLLHAKIIIVDSTMLIIGSHNITRTASIENIDVSLAMTGEEYCKQFIDFFWGLWADSKLWSK